ncbi:LysE family translocator [Thalassovita taeanensis]|uniref:Threonine/homoserine/homoserine lactone efflux protein n=1 Tax=Thalassovita taeanensis TaxID=657014 RepID=A0A1H9ATH2_9RHOB|nr:LysE family translocator [Thalassovita taeanensis]SEP79811.1 Threonine/homoserine/homoserine lactone efflux protein [Thalassovita taeanensis]
MSVDPVVFLAFIPAALALNLTPGADMMFCLGQGVRSGPRPAVAASAGISAGAFVHALAAGLGLSALIAAQPGAFDVIRWVGVGYLLWLAVQSLRMGAVPSGAPAVPAARAFREGMVVNLTNPKVILFVLAFIPQFVDPARGSVLGQFLIFGAVLALGGFVINGLVGVFAGSIGRRLTGNPAFSRWLGRVSAGIFAALALRLAVLQKG